MLPPVVWPGTRRQLLRPVLGLLLSGWLVGLAAETAPHLVHHLLDADHEPECAYLAVAAHAPAAAGSPVLVLAPPPAGGRPEAIAPPRLVAAPVQAPLSRAPPATPSAVV